MFCKQKGYLEEELDYRKQALDQAYMVGVFFVSCTSGAEKTVPRFIWGLNFSSQGDT